jgi:hypothetical protein
MSPTAATAEAGVAPTEPDAVVPKVDTVKVRPPSASRRPCLARGGATRIAPAFWRYRGVQIPKNASLALTQRFFLLGSRRQGTFAAAVWTQHDVEPTFPRITTHTGTGRSRASLATGECALVADRQGEAGGGGGTRGQQRRQRG